VNKVVVIVNDMDGRTQQASWGGDDEVRWLLNLPKETEIKFFVGPFSDEKTHKIYDWAGKLGVPVKEVTLSPG